MEITFKFIVDRVHPKKNLTLPVRLRLYFNRDFKQHSLGFAVLQKDWDEQLQQVLPSNSDHLTYNTKIASTRSKIQKFLLLNEDKEGQITPQIIIDHLTQRLEKMAPEAKPDILAYGKQHVLKLQASGNIGNSIAYSCAINKLASFVRKDKLEFEAITYKFLEDFNTWMLAEGMKVNGVSNYLRTLRALFNKAIKDGTLEARFYPFTGFKIRNSLCMA